MAELNLYNRNWREFFFEDVLTIESGKRLTKADMKVGRRPFVGASDSNNGITFFTSSINESLDSNVLGVNYNGSVGFSFYHPYEAIFSDDVKRVKWLSKEHNNRYTLLFLACIIHQQKNKYAYGYKFNGQRMKRQKILLPVDSFGSPDWLFMEEYMKHKEQIILKPTIEKLCKHLIHNEITTGGGNSLGTQWKPFYFTEVFTSIQRGKRIKKADHLVGNTPYVSSTAINNGVDGFIGNSDCVRKFQDCLTIANSGSVGYSFFHQYEFVASDHVTQLKRAGLDKYAYLFMVPIINRLSEKYSFNREINDERIKREQILLPVNIKGEVDFEFMSSYMKQVESNLLKVAIPLISKRLNNNDIQLGGVKWNNFSIFELFYPLEAGKSKGLNHIEKNNIGVSYLGATNLNNGVLSFVSPDINAIQKGNCIAFIRNGEGSMGYSIYKAEDFIATSDISVGRHPRLNRYTGTFITTIADRIRGKYNFGYKRSPARLYKEILTLPVTITGEPDWDFMENFMRSIESNLIAKYLKRMIH